MESSGSRPVCSARLVTISMKLKYLLKKYRKTLIWLVGALFTIWLDSLLRPSLVGLNKNFAEKSSSFIPGLAIDFLKVVKYEIPIYLIIIFFVIIWLLFQLYNFLILKTRKLKILKAEYGSGTTFINITTQLNNFVENDKISIPLKNSVAGLDPTPGVTKIVNIKYELNGKIFEKKFIEGKNIELP